MSALHQTMSLVPTLDHPRNTRYTAGTMAGVETPVAISWMQFGDYTRDLDNKGARLRAHKRSVCQMCQRYDPLLGGCRNKECTSHP